MLPITLEGTNHEKQRRQMIQDALEERAPKMYQALKKSLALPKFLKETEQQMMSVYREEWSKVVTKHRGPEQTEKENSIVQVQKLEMSLKRIWEETLETFLNFKD